MQLTDVIITIYCAQMKHKNIPGLVHRRSINIHCIRCSVTQPYNAFHWSLIFVLWFDDMQGWQKPQNSISASVKRNSSLSVLATGVTLFNSEKNSQWSPGSYSFVFQSCSVHCTEKNSRTFFLYFPLVFYALQYAAQCGSPGSGLVIN